MMNLTGFFMGYSPSAEALEGTAAGAGDSAAADSPDSAGSAPASDAGDIFAGEDFPSSSSSSSLSSLSWSSYNVVWLLNYSSWNCVYLGIKRRKFIGYQNVCFGFVFNLQEYLFALFITFVLFLLLVSTVQSRSNHDIKCGLCLC